jgi:HEAT repeat protein
MSTSSAWTRRAAAVAGHEGDADGARRLFHHVDVATRSSALAALDRMGKLEADVLLTALVDASPVVRRRAATLSARRCDVSLLPLLGDADHSVVEAAAFASGERSPAEPGAVELLCAVATGHPDSPCREAAVAALGAIGDPAGLPAILAATGDRATVRRRAVIALAPFEGPEVDAALARATGDRDWQVRQAAEDQLPATP